MFWNVIFNFTSKIHYKIIHFLHIKKILIGEWILLNLSYFFVKFKSTFYLNYFKSQYVFPTENTANSIPEIFILGLMECISLHGIFQEEKNSY